MATAKISKRTLMKICEALEERYGRRKVVEQEDFIEALIHQILELATAERTAREALKRIKAEYIDWNDMRVATVREIQDILGPRYPRCREKAEDLHSLLADLYTAFRSMDLSATMRTPDGMETIRALPDTTLIRADMVEWALLVDCGLQTFPTDEEQIELLRFLGGIPKKMESEEVAPALVETLESEERLRLARGLREHCDFLEQHDIFDPKPIGYRWSKPDPLGMGPKPKKAAKKKKAATRGAGKKKTTTTKSSSASSKNADGDGGTQAKKKSAAKKKAASARSSKRSATSTSKKSADPKQN
ncbi:MAG: hypothetical protein ACOCZK_01590 [Planctomycetota bacterium]